MEDNKEDRNKIGGWLFLSIFYKLVDVISTLYIIFDRGIHGEDNPVVRQMIVAYGPVAALIINAILFSLLMCLLYKYKEKSLLIVATFMQMIIALITASAIYFY